MITKSANRNTRSTKAILGFCVLFCAFCDLSNFHNFRKVFTGISRRRLNRFVRRQASIDELCNSLWVTFVQMLVLDNYPAVGTLYKFFCRCAFSERTTEVFIPHAKLFLPTLSSIV